MSPDGGCPSLTDAVTNVFLFIPWGFLLGVHLVGRRRGLPLVGIVVEAAQILLPRVADLTDVCLGAAGAALGLWIWRRGAAGA